MKTLITLMVFLVVVLGPSSSKANPGDFLYLSFDPVSASLGEGAESVRRGAVSALLSPGALGRVRNREVFLAHTFLTLDRRLSAVAISYPFGERGTLGLGILQAAVTDIDGRDFNGKHTEFYKDTRNALSFVFGFRPHPMVSIGTSLKALFRETAGQEASGTAFDVGASADVWHDVTVTATGRNIGASWPWNSDFWSDALQIQKNDDIPAAFALSVGSSSLPLGIEAGAGILKIESEDFLLSGGLQIPLDDGFVVRAGGSYDNPNIGLGFNSVLSFAEIFFDYSWGKTELTADPIHRVSLTSSF